MLWQLSKNRMEQDLFVLRKRRYSGHNSRSFGRTHKNKSVIKNSTNQTIHINMTTVSAKFMTELTVSSKPRLELVIQMKRRNFGSEKKKKKMEEGKCWTRQRI